MRFMTNSSLSGLTVCDSKSFHKENNRLGEIWAVTVDQTIILVPEAHFQCLASVPLDEAGVEAASRSAGERDVYSAGASG